MLLMGAASKSKDQKSLYLMADELSFEPYAIVLPRGDSDFRLAVNTGLSQLYDSGQIQQIFGNRWAGTSRRIVSSTKRRYSMSLNRSEDAGRMICTRYE